MEAVPFLKSELTTWSRTELAASPRVLLDLKDPLDNEWARQVLGVGGRVRAKARACI